MAKFWPMLLALVVGGALATYVWRFLGVMLAERVDTGSEFLMWVRCVATAIVAGLCAAIVLQPNRILALTSLDGRLFAIVVGVACFYAFRRSTGWGVAAALAALYLYSTVISS
jgi:branched-subunit amino acid transport protein